VQLATRLTSVHHQGIIHRDIKPSNLLVSNGTVKISDFGCSHYSEALRDASAQPGPEGDEYVDDVELAKTAGSPAFFAPEMCYSGLDDSHLPAFTLRPPSMADDHLEASRSDPLVVSPGGRTFPLKPTISNDSALSQRPGYGRTSSSSRRERLPITNAIDVWALGVTLYCLFFGKTPFDAPNEYLLMQVIPTAKYEIPSSIAKDNLPTGANASPQVVDALDLLRRLLEREPLRRIILERAKVS
jgi:serine/threonine protein kinase